MFVLGRSPDNYSVAFSQRSHINRAIIDVQKITSRLRFTPNGFEFCVERFHEDQVVAKLKLSFRFCVIISLVAEVPINNPI